MTIHWKAVEQYLENLSILDLALSGVKGPTHFLPMKKTFSGQKLFIITSFQLSDYSLQRLIAEWKRSYLVKKSNTVYFSCVNFYRESIFFAHFLPLIIRVPHLMTSMALQVMFGTVIRTISWLVLVLQIRISLLAQVKNRSEQSLKKKNINHSRQMLIARAQRAAQL